MLLSCHCHENSADTIITVSRAVFKTIGGSSIAFSLILAILHCFWKCQPLWNFQESCTGLCAYAFFCPKHRLWQLLCASFKRQLRAGLRKERPFYLDWWWCECITAILPGSADPRKVQPGSQVYQGLQTRWETLRQTHNGKWKQCFPFDLEIITKIWLLKGFPLCCDTVP